MKAYGGVEVLLHSFLILPADGGEWSVSHCGHLTPRERTFDFHRRLGGSQSSLDTFEKKQISCVF
jgi:hypothetical protein